MGLASVCPMHRGKVRTDVQDLREQKSPSGLLRGLGSIIRSYSPQAPGLGRCASSTETVVQTIGEENLPGS